MPNYPKYICFIGASTTEGMGDRERLGWVGRVVKSIDEEIVHYNLGVRGQTIFDVSQRALQECRCRIPEDGDGRIVIGCPLNDIAKASNQSSMRSLEQILQRYQKVISELSAIANVALIGPPPVLASKMPYISQTDGVEWNIETSDIDQLDSGLQTICLETGTPYISAFKGLSECAAFIEALAANDGLHPNGPGYAAQAELICASPSWTKFVSG